LSCVESEVGKAALCSLIGAGVRDEGLEQIRVVETNDNELVKKWEGVWTAVGLASSVMENEIDFGT